MLIKKNKLPLKELLLIGFLPSSLKVFIYRRKGYRLGKKVSIGLGSLIITKDAQIKDNTKIGFLTIIRASKITIGRFVSIGSFVYIDTERLEIGEDSEIREYVYVAGLKTPESKLKLGKRCGIFQYCFLNPTNPITLGDDCGIGGLSKLFTHGSYLSMLDGYPVEFAPIKLGNNVWIPWDVFILPGVTIGDNVVVGAGSIINRDIPSNCIAAGNPAKVVRENFPVPLSEEEKKSVLNEIFSEFEHHLKHHHFRAAKATFQNGFIIKFTRRIEHQLVFLEKYSALSEIVKDSVIVFNSNELGTDEAWRKTNAGMVISIPKKQRIGTSLIGEEFYKFLSRYGIRCDRLD